MCVVPTRIVWSLGHVADISGDGSNPVEEEREHLRDWFLTMQHGGGNTCYFGNYKME